MPGSWIRKTDQYPITTEQYSGPLDLLLDLIQRAELDISKLALAEVTDQFLQYVREHEDADPEYISEFILIASKLVQIKSEAILPRPPVREPEEEDPGEELARQLLVYREIKNTTNWLKERMESDLRTHLHVPHQYPVNVQFDLAGMDLTDLVLALERLAGPEKKQLTETKEFIPKLTLKKKISDILSILRSKPKMSFSDLQGQKRDRVDIIVIFLALLELVKQHFITIDQKSLFSEIMIEADATRLSEETVDLALED